MKRQLFQKVKQVFIFALLFFKKKFHIINANQDRILVRLEYYKKLNMKT